MKNSKRISGFVFLLAIIALATTIAPAQNREKFGISARAGGVNLVVGNVMVTRKGEAPDVLTNRDNLVAGDAVTTAPGSNVEILLNPGSYFRVSEKSAFQFVDDSMDSLRLKLVRGSAILEVTGVADMDLNIHVVTSQADFTIMRSGVYRIDVQPSFAELGVIKGRASFGPNRTDIVKGGNMVTFNNGYMVRAKLIRIKDNLEAWSNQRAELLAQANARLSRRTTNAYLASLNPWDFRSAFGVWAFSPISGFYTFLPFRYGWSSPYGHHYGNYCYGNPWYNRGGSNGNPIIVNNGQGSGGSGNGGGPFGGGGSGSGSSGSGPSAPASFPSMQPAPAPRQMPSIDIDRRRDP
ncbi:MAG TPA: FecR family protein [Pyrinomonadaceae bacterium]|nr:FecR family protein [Pyrinomonadaceae bacterium]